MIRSALLSCSIVLVIVAGLAGLGQSTIHSATDPALQSATKNPSSSMPWGVLFDGKSLDAWRGYKTDKVPSGWHIVDGALAKDSPTQDIVSKDEFGDFELELDWKIGEAGNSGI